MSGIFVIGGGGHAHVVASILGRPVTFIVPDAPASGEIDRRTFFQRFAKDSDVAVYLGVGDNAARRSEFDRYVAAGIVPSSLIAPTAWIAPGARIGAGTVICPGAVVGARAAIGENAIVNTLASVDHDCTIGADTHISAGVTLGGGATIGARCLVALKAGVLPKVRIGDDTTVMAGSLVTRDLGSNLLAGGNPARAMRRGP